MYAKKIITAVLLIFIIVSVVYLLAKEFSTKQSPASPSPDGLAVVQNVAADSTLNTSETADDTALSSAKIDTVKKEIDKSKKSASKIVAYYFHRTKRCPTCMKLEQYSDEAIRQGFGDALKTGRLEWKSVNIDESTNQHFEEDYQLYSQSLVLVHIVDGKQKSWRNLEKIWELVGVKEAFMTYVREELTAYLNKNS